MHEALQSSLAEYGLAIHGEVMPDGDSAWPIMGNVPAKAVILIGHGGSSFWPIFEKWHAKQDKALTHPLDHWSKDVLGTLAAEFGADPYYPSDKPYLPFQRWAIGSLGLKPSPLGILMHPKFGLWHGFRGAFAFKEWVFDTPHVPHVVAHPCDTCQDKPCLSACPVGVFSNEGVNRTLCHDYLSSDEGAATCMQMGCQARNACPIGKDYRYTTEQIQFHMAAYKSAF